MLGLGVNRSARRVLCGVLVGALGAACGGDDSSARDAGAAASGGSSAGSGGAAAAGTAIGAFTVKLVAAMPETNIAPASEATTSVIGKLKDGAEPQAIVWERTMQVGDCELLTPRVPFCDPGCGGTAICTEDGVCTPRPSAVDVGDVSIDGLGDPLVLKYIAGNYQPAAGTKLAYPPCAEGDPVTLAASGAAFGPFELLVACIAPFPSLVPGAIELGKPLALSWPAPGEPELARVDVHLDISHHGGSRGKITCDIADTGAFEIPAALVDALVELGVAGFPSVRLTRRASAFGASAALAQVQLEMQAGLDHQVSVPGVTSCTANEHCPRGQTCQTDLTCR